MNILMVTNTYIPHVGGVANSVLAFTRGYRRRGHRTVVVAPEYEGYDESEEDVIRIPAIQHFSGIDFSVMVPIPGYLEAHLKDFRPDIVHSHHPFLLGSTALRTATRLHLPLTVTHHTRYELYTHYTPIEALNMPRFVVNLSRGYENLCDRVIAPSESMRDILLERGVESPVSVVPTGVDVEQYEKGNGADIRRQYEIPPRARVIGYIGRVAKEKNLHFLAHTVIQYMQADSDGVFLLVGNGPIREDIINLFKEYDLADRLVATGSLGGQTLIDAYHAMNVFAFASKTETQGMVLTEAMAAGIPVVALDAPGSREVIRNGENGLLIRDEDPETFTRALERFFSLPAPEIDAMKKNARHTARNFSQDRCIDKMLDVYSETIRGFSERREKDESVWENAMEQIKTELALLANALGAVGRGLGAESKEKSHARGDL